MKRNILILLILTFISNEYLGQDAQLTQYFNAPLLINPALTGMVKGSRYTTNYRSQWSGIEKGYQTFGLSADVNAQKIKSGLGYSLMKDVAGVSKLSNTKHSVYYSHKLQINRNHWVNTGVRLSHNVREIDLNALYFSDQVINNNSPVTSELNLLEKTNYQEIGMGLVYYSDKMWTGIAMSHINKADISLIEGSGATVPNKFSIHGGIILSEKGYRSSKEELKLFYQYKTQQDWRQLDLGLFYKMSSYSFGGVFRAHPFVQDESLSSRDAIALVLKGEFQYGLSVGYSYDITISGLTNRSGGAHEISLIYKKLPKNRRKKIKIPPCMEF